jgi:hypothetical protein
MPNCIHLKKNGKLCGKKLSGKDEITCASHYKKQKGGFYELVYPLGASVGTATFALYKMNNLISEWYHGRTINSKKNKKR